MIRYLDDRGEQEMLDARERMRPLAAEMLNMLRAGGLSNPVAALEQLSLLLFMRHLEPARFLTFRRGPSSQPALRDELMSAVIQHPAVASHGLDRAMAGATLAFPSEQLLDVAVDRVGQLPEGPRAYADFLDAALDEVSTRTVVGSPRTPLAVSDCMLELTSPRAGERVFDPAAGAGDRMLAAIRRVKDALRVEGAELDATMVRLGAMSLTFHGIRGPQLYTRNVLADPPDAKERFDVILCQPPFGQRIDRSMLAPEFQDLPSLRSDLLFAEMAISRLADHGRAAIVLPANAAFGRNAMPLRARLLPRLRAVITLPQGTFQPHTNVETFVVFVGEASDDAVVFIDAHGESGQAGGSVLRRSGAIVNDLLHERLPLRELSPEDRARVLVVSKAAIADNECSLQPSTYEVRETATAVADSPLALLQQIEAAQAEIDRGLSDIRARLSERSPRHD